MGKILLWFPLPPDDFAAKLAAVIDPEPTLNDLGIGKVVGKPVIGKIDHASVRLRRRRNAVSSSFQPRLVATFEPAGDGTCLSGEFGVSPWWWVFMAAIPTWMALGSHFIAPAVLASPSASPDRVREIAVWLLWMVLPAFFTTAIGMIALMRHENREDQLFLADFFRRVLDAQEVPAA